jgi:hypothetical protein
VRLDAATLQMPCKPEHMQREAQVGAAKLKVRMHVCDAAGITWAVLEVDARDPALAAAVQADLQRSLAVNLDVQPGAAAPAAASQPGPGAWFVLRGRRADGSLAVASASFAAKGAQVLQRVALLPREPVPSDTLGLEAFHAAVNWAPR